MSTRQKVAGPSNPAQKRLSDFDWAFGMEFGLIIGLLKANIPEEGQGRWNIVAGHSGATQTSSSLLSTQKTLAGRQRK